MQLTHKLKGQELFSQGRYEQSIDELQEALNALKGRFRDGVEDQKQGRRLIKTVKLPCLKFISEGQWKLDRVQECEDTCNRILSIDNDCADTIFLKGSCSLKSGHLQEALTLLERACFFQPNNTQFERALKDAQELHRRKLTLSFSDRQLTKVAWYLAWVVSAVVSCLALIPISLKFGVLVFKFFYRNIERLLKGSIRLVKQTISNIIQYFCTGFRNANKQISKQYRRVFASHSRESQERIEKAKESEQEGPVRA